MDIQLTLIHEEVETVLGMLAELPLKTSLYLFNKIQSQTQAQVDESQRLKYQPPAAIPGSQEKES